MLMFRAGAEDAPTLPPPAPIALPPADALPASLHGSQPAAVVTLGADPGTDPGPPSAGAPGEAGGPAPGLRGCMDCGARGAGGTAGPSGSRVEWDPGPPTLQQAIAERLVGEAHARGSSDNLAAVVVDLGLLRNPDPNPNPSLSSTASDGRAVAGSSGAAAAGARGVAGGFVQPRCVPGAGATAVAELRPSSLVARPAGAPCHALRGCGLGYVAAPATWLPGVLVRAPCRALGGGLVLSGHGFLFINHRMPKVCSSECVDLNPACTALCLSVAPGDELSAPNCMVRKRVDWKCFSQVGIGW